MAQPNQASQNQDPVTQLDEIERNAETADRTNTQGAQSSQGGNSPQPDTTAVVTQVQKQANPTVNADSTPQDQPQGPGGTATDPATANTSAPTDGSAGTSDQPGESGTSDNPSDADPNAKDNDNQTSANNGIVAPNTSDLHGLELSINEIPNFDSYVTRCELRNAIDRAIQYATETNNSRELLILKKFKNKYFHLVTIRTICSILSQFRLGVKLPVILQKLTLSGVRK